MMEIDNFIKKVSEMRKMQIEYFRTRSSEIFKLAKQKEKEVDTFISEYQNKKMEEIKNKQLKIDFLLKN